MTARPRHDSTAGHAYLQLRTLAKAAGRATDEYLRLYALEGLVARLAASPRSTDLVVKGGVLLAAYDLRRPTADLDLSGLSLSNEVQAVTSMIIDVARTEPTRDDGLAFDTQSATAQVIRDEDEYPGVRVSMMARLATAQLHFHVDVNVGDPIWPAPQVIRLPRLLGGEIELLGYPIPMVLAEKLVTALQRGPANTRWRDFADVYSLTLTHQLEAAEVHDAIRAVADHRRVELRPLRGVLDGYADAGQRRWLAWRAKNNLADRLPAEFSTVVDRVIAFADGCLVQPVSPQSTWSPSTLHWSPGP
jgi:hypothetical protein